MIHHYDVKSKYPHWANWVCPICKTPYIKSPMSFWWCSNRCKKIFLFAFAVWLLIVVTCFIMLVH